jgi:hypothetical protein
VAFGGAFTIGAWESIFTDVAKDIVADLNDQILGKVPTQE